MTINIPQQYQPIGRVCAIPAHHQNVLCGESVGPLVSNVEHAYHLPAASARRPQTIKWGS